MLAEMPGETVLVTAMMAAKDAEGFFASFRALDPRVFACPNAGGRDAATPHDLAASAALAGLTAEACSDFEGAMRRAAARRPARILICGSLYLAGDVLERNGEAPV